MIRGYMLGVACMRFSTLAVMVQLRVGLIDLPTKYFHECWQDLQGTRVAGQAREGKPLATSHSKQRTAE